MLCVSGWESVPAPDGGAGGGGRGRRNRERAAEAGSGRAAGRCRNRAWEQGRKQTAGAETRAWEQGRWKPAAGGGAGAGIPAAGDDGCLVETGSSARWLTSKDGPVACGPGAARVAFSRAQRSCGPRRISASSVAFLRHHAPVCGHREPLGRRGSRKPGRQPPRGFARAGGASRRFAPIAPCPPAVSDHTTPRRCAGSLRRRRLRGCSHGATVKATRMAPLRRA